MLLSITLITILIIVIIIIIIIHITITISVFISMIRFVILRASPRAAGPLAIRGKKRGIIALVALAMGVVVIIIEYIIILIIINVVVIDSAELQFCQTVHLESLFFFKPLVFLRKVMSRQIDPLCCWLVFLWPAG